MRGHCCKSGIMAELEVAGGYVLHHCLPLGAYLGAKLPTMRIAKMQGGLRIEGDANAGREREFVAAASY